MKTSEIKAGNKYLGRGIARARTVTSVAFGSPATTREVVYQREGDDSTTYFCSLAQFARWASRAAT